MKKVFIGAGHGVTYPNKQKENQMHIYLTNHHEAIIQFDNTSTVTIDGHDRGTLTVNGKNYPISNGGSPPALGIGFAPNVKAAFTTPDGIIYNVISPRIERGKLASKPDPYAVIIEQRIMIDKLEKELENALERIRILEGMMKPRALNGIIFRKNKEE